MTIFDEVVDNPTLNAQSKLARLIQSTSGEADSAIKNCALIGGETGYAKAKEILIKIFGNANLTSQKRYQ